MSCWLAIYLLSLPRDLLLLVHHFIPAVIRECITSHPSFSETVKILKAYHLTESSSFDVKGDSIEFKSGAKGDETLTMTANNDIEHRHWCYALDIAIARMRKGAIKVISALILFASEPLYLTLTHYFSLRIKDYRSASPLARPQWGLALYGFIFFEVEKEVCCSD